MKRLSGKQPNHNRRRPACCPGRMICFNGNEPKAGGNGLF
ncbi:hypothetical protein BRO54_2211 [Geobacillus proteiniphilus]|uniref:Uncharacterized protein n=1 Tax=Geobacillus proteiniphilus TaxID=860353 RepID=A0A1Q5SY24_9BACL|nr:hypothetical protein BRO54_2211 [Geobacillus proteiniphilus]